MEVQQEVDASTVSITNGSEYNHNPLLQIEYAKLKICHFNITSISAKKCMSLANLMEGFDIIAIQETHTSSPTELMKRGTIPGFKLIDAIYSNAHGIATYAKDALEPFCRVTYNDYADNVHVLAVEARGVTIVNVYKPPRLNWPSETLKVFPRRAVYVGDFNCRHTQWGYKDSDKPGKQLLEWMTENSLELVFNPKDQGTCYSYKWKSYSNPDLSIVSKDISKTIKITRKILDKFPKSNHCPVMLQFG
jgi:exonuclease III